MKTQVRSKRGATVVEFGTAFVILIVFFFVPMINLSFVGVRYLIANAAINEYSHRLSLVDKRSDASALLISDIWWSQFASKCGVEITEKKLVLVVSGENDGDQLVLNPGQKVPEAYLPGGAKAPCVYNLELRVNTKIQPVYSANAGVPGLTSPLPVAIVARSNWESLGKNPVSKEFYINE